MRETHDTIKGLLAEFRGYSAGMPDSYHVTMSWADFRKMLDRFDAAHRREADYAREAYESALKAEREALREQYEAGALVDGTRGDCAKLREAVGYILKYADSVACRDHDEHTRHYIDQIRKWAQSALAAPPRNCDRYNDRVEMYGVFKDWCNARGHTMEPKLAYDAFEWLLAPATEKEGGNDGN